MMNDIQRRILAEAAKHGGANISVPDQMAAMVKEEVEVSEAEDYKTSEGTPKVIGKYTFTPFVEGSVSGWRINVKGFSKEVGFVDKPLGRNTKTSVAPNRVYFHSVPGHPDLKAFAYPSTETRVLSQREFRFAPRQLLKAVAMWMDAHGYRMVGEGLESVEEDQGTVSEYYRRGGYRSTSYSGDPRWITAKYAGTDSHGKPFKKGEEVLYFPNGKKFYTGAEAEKAWLEFLSAKGDEEGMPFAR